jgi:two-component system sensor histidine kinase VicK
MIEQQTSQPVTRLKICDLIATAIQALQPECLKLGVDITYARRKRNYVVFASRDRLQSIVFTLMQNAIQFAGTGGALKVEHERIRGKRHNDRSDFIKIGVRICGPGVSQNMFDVVVDKFQNIDRLLARKPAKKTSLVLAATQKDIFQIGGNIWVKSELGRGLTFFFTVPIEKQETNDAKKTAGRVKIVNE